MAPPWMFALLLAALPVHSLSSSSDASSPADAQGSDAAWAMGSLTIPMPMTVRRSRIWPRRQEDKRATAGVFALPIEHHAMPRLARRADAGGAGGAVEEGLEARADVAYYTTLEFGTPPQKVKVLVDTGSSELWVNPVCASAGQASEMAFCNQIERYNPQQSQTAASLRSQSGIKYGSGAVNFTYFTDRVALPNGRPMEKVQFGVATASAALSSGILGIAPGKGVTTQYSNFIDQLADQGVTPSRAYSVALGLKSEGKGTIAFGGIDSGKFAGKLKPQPIIPAKEAPDGFPRFWVNLEAISHSPPQGRGGGGGRLAGSNMPVILDTGSTLAILPTRIVSNMASAIGAGAPDATKLRPVPCQVANQPGSFDFSFNGVTIKVPYKEMIREQQGQQRCYLGVMDSGSETMALLGDTVLRSAYAVFDIDGNSVLLAQYANCGDNLRAASSSQFANLQGQCTQRDLGPNMVLSGENNKDSNLASSAAAGRLSAGMTGLAAVVLAAVGVTSGLL